MNPISSYLAPYLEYSGIAAALRPSITSCRPGKWIGVSLLQCGLSGCALRTNGVNIVEITNAAEEYYLFKIVQEVSRLRKLPGFVKVPYLEPLEHSFLIVKETVIPLQMVLNEKRYDVLASEYTDFMHVYYQEINDYEMGRKPLSRALAYVRSHSTRYGPQEALDIFQGLRILAYLGYKVVDMDSDNIGFTAEYSLVIFDALL